MRYGLLRFVACLAIVSSFLFVSCKKESAHHNHRVLIVHAFSDLDDYGERSLNSFNEAAERIEFSADFRHVYLGVPHTYDDLCLSRLREAMEHLDSIEWVPEVLILHGDEAMHTYLDYASKLPVPPKTPVVYSGVILREHWSEHPMYSKLPITGFRDSLFIRENLHFFRDIYGPHADVTFKIDRGVGDIYDEFLYQQLKDVVSNDTMYYDNLECHITYDERTSYLNADTVHPLLVNGISVRNPAMNYGKGAPGRDSLQWGRRVLRNVMRNAKDMHFMQAHLDLMADIFIDRSDLPQLSLTSLQFDDDQPVRILGGYFADLDTKAEEVLGYVRRIVHGEDIKSLPAYVHRPAYYLDWDAMQLCGLEYRDWKNKIIIKNAPFFIRQPNFYFLCFVFLFLTFISSFFYLAYYIVRNQLRQRDSIKRMQQENLEWLLGGESVGLWTVQSDGRNISIAAGAARLFNFDSGMQPIESFLRLVHPDDRDLARKIIAFDDELGYHSHRLRIRKYNSLDYRWFQISYVLEQKPNKLSEVKGLIELVDDEQKAQDKLMQSMQAVEQTRLKEAFLANMTHDIRSPLATLVSFSDMMVNEYNNLGEEERQLVAQQVDINTNTLLTLLNDVVDVSQMQLGEYRFIPKLASIKKIVESCYTANSVIVPSHLEYLLETDDDVNVFIDCDRMAQVLNNFMSNAFKNTPSGSITIGWKVLSEEVEVYVKDTGIGIPADKLPTIFDKFIKFDGQSGAGLGLNICKTIVEKQGGRITLSSEEGKYTRISAIFPIVNDSNNTTA